MASKTAVARLLEQANTPRSEKSKAGELVAMMDACVVALESDDADSMDQNIATAKPIRNDESIRKSRQADIDKCMERSAAEKGA